MTISISRMLLRSFGIAAVAVALLASSFTSPAIAADLSVKAAPVVSPPLWSAFYIGVHGGGGKGRSSLEDPSRVAFGANPVYVDSRGALAGLQVGADWQFGNFVVGAELDASWSSIKGSLTDPAAFVQPVTAGLSAQYKALATATGRVGYAFGSLLAYGKGGVAWSNVDYRSGISTEFPLSIDHQRTGLTAGGGLEFLVINNLSVRAEYDFMYFGANAIGAGCLRMSCNVDHELHLVKVGLNWRFTGDYLTARY